ncbi:MAG: DUF4261 domain-containing protein [Planctomycetales bacterium]|nr:DUF4261 domain-containing protein [Planctomycetales bacterium]
MSHGLAIVFCDDANPVVELDAVVAAIRQRWPNAALSDLEPGEALGLSLDAVPFVLGAIPAPVPWGDLKEVCVESMFWPEAEETLRGHKSHVLITAADDAAPLPRSETLTKLVTATLDAVPQATGVYWSDAEMVIAPRVFRDFAVQVMPDGPPILLWIKMCLGRSPEGGSAGYTQGLAAFGQRELETLNADEEAEVLLERFCMISEHLINDGEIADGEIVESRDGREIRAIHGQSSYGQQAPVIRLEYR